MRQTLILLIILSSVTLSCGRRAEGETEQAVDQGNAATPPIPLLAESPATSTNTPALIAMTPAPQTPTPVPAMPLPTPPSPLIDYYVIQPGDTLSGISLAYDVAIDDLLAMNGLASDSAIIQIGQTLHVPLQVSRTGPKTRLLPDSEVVYSPAYAEFDLASFIAAQGGLLANFSQVVGGETMDGAALITRVAEKYSVGPRVLLALLEFYGGWVTQNDPSSAYPLGLANPYGDDLHLQLSWTANRLNEGYYSYKRTGSMAIRFRNGSRAIVPAGLNAGTAAIQNVLAVHTNWDTWLTQVEPTGFLATYRALFGEPAEVAIEPLIPINLTQPDLQLPWEKGTTFYYSGGPHPTYIDSGSWAAVDFGPPDVLGSCFYSREPVTAAADGRLVLTRNGAMHLDLDGDGLLHTGWVLFYLHLVADGQLEDGQMVSRGTPLGVASCEGGRSNSSHLHFARRYNGEWMAAGGPVPLVLSGWQVQAGPGQYDGRMVRGGEIKVACECWDEENAVVGE